MKRRSKSVIYPEPKQPPAVLREAIDTIRPTVTVRDAKSQLSSLLDWVAGGHEITITSDGRPKARLVPVTAAQPRKIFRGMGEFLSGQPIHTEARAEEIVREDRDSRGW